jgi:hypothetical protein
MIARAFENDIKFWEEPPGDVKFWEEFPPPGDVKLSTPMERADDPLLLDDLRFAIPSSSSEEE